MISIKAPKINAAETKQLASARAELEAVIAEVKGAFKKVEALRAKENHLEKEALKLHRDAANFHSSAELALLANQATIARVHDAIHEAESECAEDKLPLFYAIDSAQELVSRICQQTYNELLDQIGSALAPYYRGFDDARFVARGTHAVNDLVINLLSHKAAQFNSIERLFQVATDTLRKVDACLNGSEIWVYQGGQVPANGRQKAAA